MPHGAYGFTIEGLESNATLGASAATWPSLLVRCELGESASTAANGEGPPIGPDRARLTLLGDMLLELERASRTAIYTGPRRLDDDELVHPYLVPAAGIFARWLGREPLHAGGLVLGDRGWALLGERESGKSSTLAAAALAGYPVLSDDLLVVHDGKALAGPRCIDLRAESAAHLGTGEQVPSVREGGRYRLELGPAPAEVTLAGWIFLAWGDELELRRVPPGERLPAIAGQRMVQALADEPAALLDLAALPAWELRRPRALGSLPDALALLVDRLAG
jgi:hypothetical protein